VAGGFGGEVRAAIDSRVEHLFGQGLTRCVAAKFPAGRVRNDALALPAYRIFQLFQNNFVAL
jgi:hypothetical protein